MHINVFEKLSDGFQDKWISIIDSTYSKKDFIRLDLSTHNPDLNKVNTSSSDELQQYINSHIKENKRKVAFGGYLEKRGIYRRSEYFNKVESPLNERNIHLGIDIWIEAGTNVCAALDGEVHSYANNTNFGDYGPTIILQHCVTEGVFYTLYGHLSKESIQSIEIGQKVERGEVIAQLGRTEENGEYPPHLHFQVILDVEHYKGDYPGVSSQRDLEYYKRNCPNPNLLLKLDK